MGIRAGAAVSLLKSFVTDENGRTGVVIGHAYVTQALDILWSDGKIARGVKLEQVRFVRQQDERQQDVGHGTIHDRAAGGEV
jgi:hypothetical protein